MISEFIFFPALFVFVAAAFALTVWITKRWRARALPECIQQHLPEYQEVFPPMMGTAVARTVTGMLVEWGGSVVGMLVFTDLLFDVWGVPVDLVG